MNTASASMPSSAKTVAVRTGRSCARWLILTLLVAIPAHSQAISLYDVIELSRSGYSDQQIIKLIETTNARFQLDTDSIITLKEAGVSETVIKALIEAGPPGPPAPLETSGPAEPQAPGEEHGEASAHNHAQEGVVAVASPPPGALLQKGPFSSYPFQEPGLGHAGSHQHHALALRGLAMFILRSEAGYTRIADRARTATDLLNQLVRNQSDGSFSASPEPDAAVWYQTTSYQPVRILTVAQADVIAYQRRSLGAVSKGRLAAYWAALLNDYMNLFVLRRPPTELGGLHLGEALNRIHEEFSSGTAMETDTPVDASTMALKVLDHLTGDDKEHLLELATRIPAEFQEYGEVSP